MQKPKKDSLRRGEKDAQRGPFSAFTPLIVYPIFFSIIVLNHFLFCSTLYYLYYVRKIFIVCLLIATVKAGWAVEVFHFEVYGDSQKTGGARISLPVAEIRASSEPDKYNFGFLLTSAKFMKKLPVEIKFGNLSAGGSLSRLNSPELSNGTSPFSNGISSVTGISASLPGYTSFSKPESTFLQLKANQLVKHPFSFCANVWISPENSSPVFSVQLCDKFLNNQIVLTSAFTTGRFYYDEKNSSSWFLESPYYIADSHLCSQLQFSAEFKNKNRKASFYTGLTTGIYESPFGPFTAVYRLDLKLSIKQTDFYTSAFLNQYEETLTSSAKTLSPCIQLKGGFLTKRPVLIGKQNLYFLRIGINAYSKINLTDTEHPLRINAGLQLTSDLTTISFSASANTALLSKSPELPPEDISFNSISAQIKNAWYLKNFTPSITMTAEKRFNTASDKNDDMKYKLQLNLTHNSKCKITSGCAFSFSAKDNSICDKKLSANLNCRVNLKMFTLIGKLTISSLYLE